MCYNTQCKNNIFFWLQTQPLTIRYGDNKLVRGDGIEPPIHIHDLFSVSTLYMYFIITMKMFIWYQRTFSIP